MTDQYILSTFHKVLEKCSKNVWYKWVDRDGIDFKQVLIEMRDSGEPIFISEERQMFMVKELAAEYLTTQPVFSDGFYFGFSTGWKITGKTAIGHVPGLTQKEMCGEWEDVETKAGKKRMKTDEPRTEYYFNDQIISIEAPRKKRR